MLRVTRWHWLIATAFWTFIAAMYAAQIVWMAQIPGERVNVRAAIAWQSTYYAAWIPATIFVWRVSGGWFADVDRQWSRVLWHIPLFATVFSSIVLVVSLVAPWLADQREPFWPMYLMQLRGRVHLMVLIYTAVAGMGSTLLLFERHRERQATEARLQSELAAARLRALRGHLEPHFLFNSLHSIAALARTSDTAGVVRLTASLSDILRHVIEVGDRPSRLGDEFAVAERYLDIQRVRFTDRLNVMLSLDASAADARVPLLVVQPLVENALKHGLMPRVQHGTLAVRGWVDGGVTHIAVEDDGAGLPGGWTLDRSAGTGLRNLSARLVAEYGDCATLAVTPRAGRGVCAHVQLPYERV